MISKKNSDGVGFGIFDWDGRFLQKFSIVFRRMSEVPTNEYRLDSCKRQEMSLPSLPPLSLRLDQSNQNGLGSHSQTTVKSDLTLNGAYLER